MYVLSDCKEYDLRVRATWGAKVEGHTGDGVTGQVSR